MARPKEIIDPQLVHQAKRELAKRPSDRVYFRLLAVVKAGDHPITEVARFLEVSRDTVSRWIKRFRADGVAGLQDRPKGHNPSKLSPEQRQEITTWLANGRNAQGKPVHWTLEKLQQALQQEYDISLSLMPLWCHVRQLGFRQRVPRPRHTRADRQKQDTFKKNG